MAISSIKRKSVSTRDINALPDQEDFNNIMYNRFWHLLERFDFLQQPFLLFINTLDRSKKREKEPRNKIQDYIYGGIDQMIVHAKENRARAQQESSIERLNTAAEAAIFDQRLQQFREATVLAKVNGKENKKTVSYLYQRSGIGLKDIAEKFTGSMPQYFSGKLSDNQELEKQLLFESFGAGNLKQNYYYLSLPLIVFGEYDGVVHVVHHKKDHQRLGLADAKEKEADYEAFLSNIIKGFSYETEAIWLDWEIIGEHLHLLSAIEEIIRQVDSQEFRQRMKKEADRVQILEELKYVEYYKKQCQEYYYKIRLDQSNKVTEELYKKDLNNVIIKILLDSYAHNVSAHSLTALNWKLKYRAEKRRIREKKLTLWRHLNEKKHEDEGFLSDFFEVTEELLLPKRNHENTNTINYLQEFPGSLSIELQPLIAYLMEKGTFWSGVSRDFNFGGIIIDLFSILWKDFINNPLFLGTIAQSEGIVTINLKVIIFEDDLNFSFVQKKALSVKKTIARRAGDKKQLEGSLGTIHIGRAHDDLPLPEGLTEMEEELINNRSKFVTPGDDFLMLKRELEQKKLFIPGGVVGKQALLTMLENEIRNIKHYQQGASQKSCLDLVFSVQKVPARPKIREAELYQLGVWLKRTTYLDQSQININWKGNGKQITDRSPKHTDLLIYQKHKQLYADLIDRKRKSVKLGGTYQDKVCASFLINGSFSEVQKPRKSTDVNDNKAKKNPNFSVYYPWLISATSVPREEQTNTIQDFCLIGKVEGIRDESEEKIEEKEVLSKALYEEYPHQYPQKGYLKKFFHCWIGENVKSLDKWIEKEEFENSYLTSEDGFLTNNLRYRFLCTKQPEDYLKYKKKLSGCIRIVGDCPDFHNLPDEEGLSKIYAKWLSKWLGSHETLFNLFQPESTRTEPTPFLALHLEGSSSALTIHRPFRPVRLTSVKSANQIDLKIIHSKFTDSRWLYLGYKNHGVFKQYYEYSSDKNPAEHRQLEFLETIFTQISIFDNRCFQRVVEVDKEIQKRKTKLYEEKLNLRFFEEKKDQWGKFKKVLNDTHFLIIHFTFIEQIIKDKFPINGQMESKLGFFIENEIPKKIRERGEQGKFFLIVTTGRGRIDWWENLQKSEAYKAFLSFTTFRPIEPILSVIEDAQSKKDDIDLKHYLVKVIFGS